MNFGNCKASNNVHPNFPAMMSSGDLYTDYTESCKMNNEIKQKAGIKTNYNYRQWLIKNADSVMKNNMDMARDQCCDGGDKFAPVANSVKHLFKNCSDKSKPFGYEESDLKNLYLSRTDLESRLRAPIMSQAEMLKMGKPNYN